MTKPSAPTRSRLTLESNLGLVFSIMQRIGSSHDMPPEEIDELRQCGLMALEDAVIKFEPRRGFAFSTYATRCIYNRMVQYVRTRCRYRERFGQWNEALGDRIAGDSSDPLGGMVHAERLVAMHAAMLRLDDRTRAIVALRFLHDPPVTLCEVARRFGITKERVRQIQVKALAKLHRIMEGFGNA